MPIKKLLLPNYSMVQKAMTLPFSFTHMHTHTDAHTHTRTVTKGLTRLIV